VHHGARMDQAHRMVGPMVAMMPRSVIDDMRDKHAEGTIEHAVLGIVAQIRDAAETAKLNSVPLLFDDVNYLIVDLYQLDQDPKARGRRSLLTWAHDAHRMGMSRERWEREPKTRRMAQDFGIEDEITKVSLCEFDRPKRW
jgi:hypothetical protein